MVYSGEIGQTLYKQEMAIAVPGMYIGMGPYYAMPYMNNASGVRPVYTVTPPATVDANTTYTILFDGATPVSFTTGGATTTAQLGAGLLAAIRANGEAFRKVDATINAGTGVITLTGRYFNVPVLITSPTNATTTNDLTIAQTVAPGTNVDIPFGRFVGRTAADEIEGPTGISNARMINSTSGFTVLGVTMKAFLEKTSIGPTANSFYKQGQTMNVLGDCVGIQGIWVDCIETDIVLTDSVYIAVSAGNEGKVTKSASGTINLSSRANFMTTSQVSPWGTPMVGVYLKR